MNEILGLVALPGQQQRVFLLPQDPNQLHMVTCLGGCEAKAERHSGPPLSLWDVLSSAGALQGEGAVSQPTCRFSRGVILCVVTEKSVGDTRSEQHALDKTQLMHFPTVLPNPVIWWQF